MKSIKYQNKLNLIKFPIINIPVQIYKDRK